MPPPSQVNALLPGAAKGAEQAAEEEEGTARFAECAQSWLMLLRVLRRYTRTQTPGAYESTFMADVLGCKRAPSR